MERIETNRYHIEVKKGEKHTCSFYLAICLIISMLVQFYLPVFLDLDETVIGDYLFLSISGVIFICEILFLFMRNIRISYRAIGMFLAVVCALGISLLFTRSGVEKTFSLLSILVGLYILYKEPLQRSERNGIFWLFVVSIILILLNGALGDADSVALGKFNPNTCAFILAMLYCVCITRYFHRRAWLDIVLALACFLLQFLYISRTALLGEVLFTFCALVCRAWRKNTFSHRTVFWVILCFSVFGLILAYFYSEVLYPAVGHGKIVIFGKDLFTGRQTIWNFAFESIREHFWFGVGSHLNEAQFEAGYYEWIMNAHNQPLGVLSAFGITAFILFYMAFAFFAAQPYREEGSVRMSRFPAIFLLMVTLMSYFEIYFFSLNTWIVILIAYALISSESVLTKRI